MDKLPDPTPTKTTPTKTKTNNEELDWNDDGYEPAEIKLPANHGTEHLTQIEDTKDKEEQDHKVEKDEWLAPLHCGKGSETTTAQTAAKKHYLTKQFERLSTPASAKKSRCVNCTRVVVEGSKYCAKCKK